jgi:CelD/BcsL family acetyltransferase involved in cellulose biosynthesis
VTTHLVGREEQVVLERVLDDDPLVGVLGGSLPSRGARLDLGNATPSPWIALRGRFDAWLDGLPGGAGAQLRRRRRWLRGRPGFRIEVVTQPEAMGAAMEVLFALHRARWSIAGGSDGIRGAAAEAFHRVSARGLAERGWARVYLLHAEGAPRAALYGFGRGGRFAFYQSGHEPAWRRRSVGTVLLCAAIEDAFARGEHEFDLLHGDETYKRTYASGSRRLVDLHLAIGARPLLLRRVEVARGRLRALARDTLPAGWVESIRRRRRGGAA